MKVLIATILAVAASGADARGVKPTYPSCDLPAQRALKGDIGGSIRDERQAHIAMRANILQADIGSARKARRLTRREADRLWQRVAAVRRDSDGYTRKQGFLSAAERASYDRELDAVATRVCRTGT